MATSCHRAQAPGRADTRQQEDEDRGVAAWIPATGLGSPTAPPAHPWIPDFQGSPACSPPARPWQLRDLTPSCSCTEDISGWEVLAFPAIHAESLRPAAWSLAIERKRVSLLSFLIRQNLPRLLGRDGSGAGLLGAFPIGQGWGAVGSGPAPCPRTPRWHSICSVWP